MMRSTQCILPFASRGSSGAKNEGVDMGTTQGESCREGTFAKTHPFERRRAQGMTILTKYPDRIPVIVEKSRSADKSVPDVDKKKFLVTRDMTLGQFVFVIRKRLVLSPEKAIFVFINNI